MSAPPCARCRFALPTCSLRYITEIAIIADFDPVMVVPEDIDGEIERTLRAMQDAAEEGLAGRLQ